MSRTRGDGTTRTDPGTCRAAFARPARLSGSVITARRLTPFPQMYLPPLARPTATSYGENGVVRAEMGGRSV